MVFKTYEWSTVQYATPAETVGAVLEGIAVRDGKVTNKAFLDESRPETSPTHEMFEWRDDVAAEKYRLNQATQIIGNLHVTVQMKESEPPKLMRAMVNVVPDKHKRAEFMKLETVMKDTDLRSVTLQHALEELRTFRRKYNDLEELSEVFSAIDKAEASA